MINRRIAKIKVRRGTDNQRKQVIFEDGELVLCSDIERLYVGDGVTYGGVLLSNRGYVLQNVTSTPDFVRVGDIVFDSVSNTLYIAISGLNSTITLRTLFSIGGGGASNVLTAGDLDPLTFVYDGSHWKLANHSVHNINLNSDTVHLSGGLGVDDDGLFIKYDTNAFKYDGGINKFTINYDPNTLTTAAGSLSVLDSPSDWVSTNFVHVSGDTVRGPLTVSSSFTAASSMTVNGSLSALSSVNISGDTTFNNNLINNFRAKVKTINLTVGSNVYPLTLLDCGSVLLISGETASYVSIPRDLPIGYNVLVISNSDNNITFRPLENTGGVSIGNLYGYRTLSVKEGMCNLIITSSNKAVIAGDLS